MFFYCCCVNLKALFVYFSAWYILACILIPLNVPCVLHFTPSLLVCKGFGCVRFYNILLHAQILIDICSGLFVLSYPSWFLHSTCSKQKKENYTTVFFCVCVYASIHLERKPAPVNFFTTCSLPLILCKSQLKCDRYTAHWERMNICYGGLDKTGIFM